MPTKRVAAALPIRSKCEIEEGKNGKHSIVVTEIPVSGEPYEPPAEARRADSRQEASRDFERA